MRKGIFIMLIPALITAFASCTKNSIPFEESTLVLVDDNTLSEVAFDDVFNTVDNATIMFENALPKGDLKSGTILGDSCPVVTVTNPGTGTWPKTITIDYGEGCEGFHGSTRSGRIIVTITERRNVLNATRTVTFDNYYFNGIKVEGTKEVKNIGLNTNQNMVFLVTLTGGKLTLENGRTIEREFEHEREWIAGWLTKNIWDDECLITGSATGRNINGVSYRNTITSALHWKRVCEFFTSGVILFERDGFDQAELDYGTGECDAFATLKRGDQTKQITLRHRHRLMP